MKKILILLIATVLLSSCFGKDAEQTPEDIVSNVVEITEENSSETPEATPEETEVTEEESSEEETSEEEVSEPSEQVVSGSENDPRVDNTQ